MIWLVSIDVAFCLTYGIDGSYSGCHTLAASCIPLTLTVDIESRVLTCSSRGHLPVQTACIYMSLRGPITAAIQQPVFCVVPAFVLGGCLDLPPIAIPARYGAAVCTCSNLAPIPLNLTSEIVMRGCAPPKYGSNRAV